MGGIKSGSASGISSSAIAEQNGSPPTLDHMEGLRSLTIHALVVF
ncbi:MAG TPA: hypothetical protein VGD69_20490 [Herpetosiphonaceae bacterium]